MIPSAWIPSIQTAGLLLSFSHDIWRIREWTGAIEEDKDQIRRRLSGDVESESSRQRQCCDRSSDYDSRTATAAHKEEKEEQLKEGKKMKKRKKKSKETRKKRSKKDKRKSRKNDKKKKKKTKDR